MGMFGSLFGAPKKKKNPWEYDPTMAAQEAAWGFPAKEDPEMVKPKSDRWIDGGNFTGKDALAIALTSVGDAFSRQAGGRGDTLSSYMGRATSARDAARKAQIKAQTDAAEREASMRRIGAARNDLNPAQIESVAYGDLTPDQVMPKQPDEPAFVKNYNAWKKTPVEDQQGIANMQSVLNPGYYNGLDGKRYQNTPPPPDFIPDPPAPAPMGGGTVNTPPELEAMRQLYLRQLGPVNGEAAFREYAKSIRR